MTRADSLFPQAQPGATTRRRRRALFVVLAGALAVAPFAPVGLLSPLGCSGPANLRELDDAPPKKDAGKKDAGHKADASDETVAEYQAACASYAAVICAKLDACSLSVNVLETYGSTDECVAREAISCVASFEAPDNGGTTAGLARCGADITAGSCADFFDHTNLPSPCVARPGPRADGADCAFNGQCQSTWCYVGTYATCGTCTERPDGGAACMTNADCGGQGLHCSSVNTCVPVVPATSACGAENVCAFGTTCVTPDGGAMGTCEVEGALGTHCDAAKATGPLCFGTGGLFCPSATQACASIGEVNAFQLCGVTPGVAAVKGGPRGPSMLTHCTGGSLCAPATASSGRCSPPADDGRACDTNLGPPCLPPARCLTESDASTAGYCAILGVTTSCN